MSERRKFGDGENNQFSSNTKTSPSKVSAQTPVDSHVAGNPQESDTSLGEGSSRVSTAEVRIVGLDRSSTEKQFGDDKAQRDLNKRTYESFARQPGFLSVGYYAYAESGALTDGKRHKKIQDLIKKRRIDAVWFPDEKRASRSTKGGLQWFEDLTKAGIRIFIGARELKQDASSHIATGVNLSIAEGERITLRERALSQHYYVAQGQWLAKKPPYGYNKDPDSRLLSLDEAEMAVVREIYHAAAAEPFATTKLHVATRAGGLTRTETRKILANPIYKGLIPWGDQHHPFEDYRVIDDELWAEAQIPERLRLNKTERAIDRLAIEIGNSVLLADFIRRVPIPCQKCPPTEDCPPCSVLMNRDRSAGGRPAAENPHRLRFLGTVAIGAYEIPKIGCRHGHETQLIGSRQVHAARQVIRCCHCDNRDSNQFWVRGVQGSNKFDLQCKLCGKMQARWDFHPFKGKPVPSGVKITLLDDFKGGEPD